MSYEVTVSLRDDDSVISETILITTESYDEAAEMLSEIIPVFENEWTPCPEDEHEWIDARNELVLSGEVCVNCWEIRASNHV